MTVHRRVLIDQFGPPLRLQVIEGKDGGILVVEGKIGHADKVTANNRVYPRAILEREIARLQPRIKQGSVLGAVDHPGDGKSRVREAGCIMRALWMKPNGEVHGKFEVVEGADAGRNLAAFLRRGAAIGMSSRGMGSTSVGPKGFDVVGEDFKLNTWDFVADPACHDAYPQMFTEDVDTEGNPTGKILIDPEQVTESALRQRFPDAVREIEEHSLRVASETIAENIDEDRVDLRAEIAEELREDFAVKLVRSLAEMRTVVEEEVRSDFASDPATAGAKMALAKISEMVHPYRPDPDGKKILDEKDIQITELTKTVDEQEAAVQAESSKIERLEQKGRELAFRLYVAEQLAGHPYRDRVRDMIGDISECKSPEELRTRVEAALTTVKDAQEQAEEKADERAQLAEAHAHAAETHADAAEKRLHLLDEQNDAFREAIAERIDGLEGQFRSALAGKDKELSKARRLIARREDELQEALDTGERATLFAYASDRTIGHPKRRQIMEAVHDGRIRSQGKLDRVASRNEVRAQEAGGPLERVRRAMSSGREHMREDERVDYEQQLLEEEQNQGNGNGEAAHDLSFLGQSLTEQRDLAQAVSNGQSRRR